jgi:predicted phage-related endonuclease
MSTNKQIKHLLKTNVFGITDKVKAFQKPKRDNRFKNKRVRG